MDEGTQNFKFEQYTTGVWPKQDGVRAYQLEALDWLTVLRSQLGPRGSPIEVQEDQVTEAF